MKMPVNRITLTAITLALLGACTMGPNYVRPAMETPAAFKELGNWKTAEPRDQEIRGKWWEGFNDPLLNSLEDQVDISNQTLAQAEARYRQASAATREARAAYFPTISGSLSARRTSSPATRSDGGGDSNSFSLGVNAAWEPDLWGRIRRTVEASSASAQASAADLEAARLSTHAQLAQTYFQLRTLDAQMQLLDRTLLDYARSVKLTENQYNAGQVAKANLILAQTQQKSAQAQRLDLGIQRAQLEHAIAVLIGKAPAEFSITAAPLAAALPVLPVGLPSSLLERRPDIAAAERRVAAANAQIGVAKTAYFPDLSLTGSIGSQGSTIAQLLSLPNRVWSFGPALALTLFDAGARKAQTDQAIAAHEGSVAAYRQTVLSGFQEVEDNLVALRVLDQEAQIQNEALQLARQSVTIANNQYRAGIVDYLNVISAQTTALNSERNAVEILNRRLNASVLLVKALGGGWRAAALENPDGRVQQK
ncbi:efflux transporter outer membrane subunit [soil metagenome]